MRWKQCVQVARAMEDSETPDQPKRARARAVWSVWEVGGAEGAKRLGLVLLSWATMEEMEGPGWVMFSCKGREGAMARREV